METLSQYFGEADNIGVARNDVEQVLSDQGYDVNTDVAIVTAKPSVSPSFTTFVPSPAPSITGVVVTLSLSTTDEILNVTEITALEANIAEEYGVSVDDVTVEATYSVTGSMEIDISDDLTETELVEILEQSIADALGVHARDVDVVYDAETGEVTYAVSSDDNVAAEEIQESLQSTSFLNDLNDGLLTVIPEASVTSIEAEDNIEMELLVTIDASEAAVDVEETNARVTSEFENDGFSADSSSNT